MAFISDCTAEGLKAVLAFHTSRIRDSLDRLEAEGERRKAKLLEQVKKTFGWALLTSLEFKPNKVHFSTFHIQNKPSSGIKS